MLNISFCLDSWIKYSHTVNSFENTITIIEKKIELIFMTTIQDLEFPCKNNYDITNLLIKELNIKADLDTHT